MLWFIGGVLAGWVILSILHEYFWGQRFIEIIELPVVVLEFILELILAPFVWVYLVFFRHTLKPVELERIKELKIMEDSKHLFGSFYICFDKKARRLSNKIFCYRVKKPLDKPKDV